MAGTFGGNENHANTKRVVGTLNCQREKEYKFLQRGMLKPPGICLEIVERREHFGSGRRYGTI